MKNKSQLVFVIQKHHATSLHYDFRLQIGDTMASWAIPKGPTLDNTLKRLAMRVDDHPMSYNDFEGIIEEGGYGAGPVMIWDFGTYIAEIEISKGIRKQIPDTTEGDRVMQEGLQKGEIKFILEGSKLKGSFALVKTKGFPPGRSENAWLLIKHKDDFCESGYDAKDYDISAKSGKTLKEIESEKS
jgi:bifunctional non-homologous end joining protein LigD